jgi:type VI secretion system secreted protein VgrG
VASLTLTQATRPLTLTTPLGPDVLLPVAFHGREAISKPFVYRLDLVAPNRTSVEFERLMGQTVTLGLRRDRLPPRYFHGRVWRFSQGHSDAEYTHYQAELVPDFWLLTKRHASRIFQHLSVPDILRQVLQGLDVSYELQGMFHPRDYCVQYRETDFAFASRLMEDDGIYYFFKHGPRGCQLVLGNSPPGHPTVPDMRDARFDDGRGGRRDEERVVRWQKVQDLRSSKCRLRDHCFELPRQRLEAERPIQDEVTVGRVRHRLSPGSNGRLAIDDYPGGYAQRFDGVDRGGGDRPDELRKIFDDGERTARIRMGQEAVPGLTIHGGGTCHQFLPGHAFTLAGHGHGDGPYVLTQVEHTARQPGPTSSDGDAPFAYENTFTAIPRDLPYLPPRETPRPLIHGPQTATVVGPAGEEIHVDKYGRVKVQFHWDRDATPGDCSCWIRVAQQWAGKSFGTAYWPRVGHEVVVAFEDGDPDCPIIIGSVYNAENTTPRELPKRKNRSGVWTRSTPGAGLDEFSALVFDDTRGQELVYLRAQRDCRREVKHNDYLTVGNAQEVVIKNGRKTTVVNGDDERHVEAGSVTTSIHGDRNTTVGGDDSLTVKGTLSATAGDAIVLSTGAAALIMKSDGTILLKGTDVAVLGSGTITERAGGTMTLKGAVIRLN